MSAWRFRVARMQHQPRDASAIQKMGLDDFVEIGLARGKREVDRRQDIARRDADREAERAMANTNRRGRSR